MAQIDDHVSHNERMVEQIRLLTRVGLAISALLLAVGLVARLLDIDAARPIIRFGLGGLLLLAWLRETVVLVAMRLAGQSGLVWCSVFTLAILGSVMLYNLFGLLF